MVSTTIAPLAMNVAERNLERSQELIIGKRVDTRKKQYVTCVVLEVFIIRKW
jgi:hypothetical protein